MEERKSYEDYRSIINAKMDELFDSLHKIIYDEIANKKEGGCVNEKKIKAICDVLKNLTDKTITDFFHLAIKYENLENDYNNLLFEIGYK